MKFLITGSDGLLGSGFKAIAKRMPEHNFLFANHKNWDMTNQYQAARLINSGNYDCVVNCAALVGGIKINKERPADMFHENILINTNVIKTCQLANIKKLFMFSSACAFPDGIYPLTEDMIQDGKPFEGNYAYGYSKRMVDILVKAYNQQFGLNYCTLIPVSLYGPHDNFSLENGHFIPSLIHKAYLSKQNDEPLNVWGDGSPLRELIYAEDLASIIVKLSEIDKLPHNKYLIGSGVEVTVGDMARTIAKIMGVKGVIFDKTKPNGQYRKPADSSRLKSVLGDFKYTDYEEALKTTVIHFLENYSKIRK
jgi:GDP-L-fucose synthase